MGWRHIRLRIGPGFVCAHQTSGCSKCGVVAGLRGGEKTCRAKTTRRSNSLVRIRAPNPPFPAGTGLQLQRIDGAMRRKSQLRVPEAGPAEPGAGTTYIKQRWLNHDQCQQGLSWKLCKVCCHHLDGCTRLRPLSGASWPESADAMRSPKSRAALEPRRPGWHENI